MWERIVDRFTTIISNLMRENYELRKQLEEQNAIIAKMIADGRRPQ